MNAGNGAGQRVDRFEISRPEVIDSVVDGEVVVISLTTGSYYNISGAGTDVWTVLEHPSTVAEIVDRLARRYDADDGAIGSTVSRFVDELVAESLIRSTDAGALPEQAADDPGGARAAFASPVLEKFTDMEDLLLLDPVHDVTEQGWPHARNV